VAQAEAYREAAEVVVGVAEAVEAYPEAVAL
jgi:hypothetical protein